MVERSRHPASDDPSAVVARARARAAAVLGRSGEGPARLIVVDVDHQRLYLIEDGRITADYPVSTAAAGVGGREGSLRTPPGVHRIQRRIGAGEPSGAVFVDREPTGRSWEGEPESDDLILTRILTLEGEEEGINRGPGYDSLERMIYIHGTNHESMLGVPASHGCVRLSNRDVIDLFDRVATGDPVVIV